MKKPETLAHEAEQLLADLIPRQAALKPKDRIAIPAQEMPTQDPQIRRTNMQEVALG